MSDPTDSDDESPHEKELRKLLWKGGASGLWLQIRDLHRTGLREAEVRILRALPTHEAEVAIAAMKAAL